MSRRPLGLSAGTIAISNGAFSATLYLLTVQLQRLDGLSAVEAGIAVIPLAVASALGGLAAPRLGALLGRRATITIGLVSSGSGLAVLPSQSVPASLAMVLIGIGAGAVMTLGADTVMRSAPLERTGDAGAIQESAFALGAGIGVATLGAIALAGSNDGGSPLPGLSWAYGVGAVTMLATAAVFVARYVDHNHGAAARRPILTT